MLASPWRRTACVQANEHSNSEFAECWERKCHSEPWVLPRSGPHKTFKDVYSENIPLQRHTLCYHPFVLSDSDSLLLIYIVINLRRKHLSAFCFYFKMSLSALQVHNLAHSYPLADHSVEFSRQDRHRVVCMERCLVIESSNLPKMLCCVTLL